MIAYWSSRSVRTVRLALDRNISFFMQNGYNSVWC